MLRVGAVGRNIVAQCYEIELMFPAHLRAAGTYALHAGLTLCLHPPRHSVGVITYDIDLD